MSDPLARYYRYFYTRSRNYRRIIFILDPVVAGRRNILVTDPVQTLVTSYVWYLFNSYTSGNIAYISLDVFTQKSENANRYNI